MAVDDLNEDGLIERGAEGTTASEADQAPPLGSDSADSLVTPGPGDSGSGGAGGSPVTEPAQEPGWQSFREVAEKVYGYTFPEGAAADDAQALSHLVNAARAAQQADVYSQIGRQIAPHADEVREFIGRKRAPVAEPSPWDQPAWDDRWESMLELNKETGILVGKPGVPPQVVDSANKYVEWNRRVNRDPAGYQAHLFEKQFLPKVRELITEDRERARQDMVIQNIIRANSSWIYLKDERGLAIVDQQGQRMLSPAGARWADLTRELGESGVADPRQRDAIARRLLLAEVQEASGKTAPAAPPIQTRQAANPPNRNAAGTLSARERRVDPAAVEPSVEGLSLNDAMSRALSGFSDQDFNPGN